MFVARVAVMAYYVFFSIYIDNLGMDDGLKGLAWSVGVASEVVMMFFSSSITKRIGVRVLFGLELIGIVVRSSIYALYLIVWVIFAAQCLHSLTFAALHVTLIRIVAAEAPLGRSGTAQLTFAAIALGGGGAVGGWLT